jgi:uncharacterized membrane protein
LQWVMVGMVVSIIIVTIIIIIIIIAHFQYRLASDLSGGRERDISCRFGIGVDSGTHYGSVHLRFQVLSISAVKRYRYAQGDILSSHMPTDLHAGHVLR